VLAVNQRLAEQLSAREISRSPEVRYDGPAPAVARQQLPAASLPFPVALAVSLLSFVRPQMLRHMRIARGEAAGWREMSQLRYLLRRRPPRPSYSPIAVQCLIFFLARVMASDAEFLTFNPIRPAAIMKYWPVLCLSSLGFGSGLICNPVSSGPGACDLFQRNGTRTRILFISTGLIEGLDNAERWKFPPVAYVLHLGDCHRAFGNRACLRNDENRPS
jgi:hypothetical protein